LVAAAGEMAAVTDTVVAVADIAMKADTIVITDIGAAVADIMTGHTVNTLT
jgi:hypothetical protein